MRSNLFRSKMLRLFRDVRRSPPRRQPSLSFDLLESREVLDGTIGTLMVRLADGAALPADNWGRTVQSTPLPGWYEVAGPDLTAADPQITADPNVILIEANNVVSRSLAPDDPSFTNGSLWGLSGANGIQAPNVWDTTTGSATISVGVVDTGIDVTHPDLFRNIWINQGEIPTSVRNAIQANPAWDVDSDGLITFWDLNDTRNQGAGKITDLDSDGKITAMDILFQTTSGGWANDVSDDGDSYVDDLIGWNFVADNNRPFDDDSHGTHVSGTIGAIGNNGLGVVGVNWKTQLQAIKILDSNGEGSELDGGLGILYSARHGARVSNNSWNGDLYSQFLVDAITAAGDLNHLVVVSAGNQSTNIDGGTAYPASYPMANIVSVAAITSSGGLAGFSNYGAAFVDLGAPGTNILSTVPGSSPSGNYAPFNGTSMAAPHVTGAIALVLAAAPDLAAADAKALLLARVTPNPTLAGITVSGGHLNLAGIFSGPEIQMSVDGALIENNHSLEFDDTLPGVPVSKTFTIRNVGIQPLVLGSITVPSGYSLVSGPAATTLGPGQSTSFVVRLNADVIGTHAGQIVISSNDSSESALRINVTGAVIDPPSVQYLENGQRRFTTVGSWTPSQGEGSGGSTLFAAAGNGSSVASWSFLVYPGRYRIAATWSVHPNRATNAPYSIYDDSTLLTTVRANQEQAPTGISDAGGTWKELGFVNITGNRLVVTLSNLANEYVIADAIRIERVADLIATPNAVIADGSTLLVGGSSTVDFGSTMLLTPVTKTFTITNTGNQPLTLGTISVPAGYSVATGYGSSTLAPNASTTFTIRLDAGAVGTPSGTVTLASNDPNAPFRFNVSATVAAPPTIQILNNGQTGFSTVGAWKTTPGEGHGGSDMFSPAGSGSSVATWSFVVSPGFFRISATWAASVNRATNSPFSIYDGSTLLATINVNQEQTPNDFADSGAGWKNLGSFDVAGNRLIITLSNAANEYVIADAIRVERVRDTIIAPTASVADGSAGIVQDATVSFGTALVGASVTKTFTVTNSGNQPLVLGAIGVPAGYSVAVGYGAGTLAPGASTTFTLRFNASAAGTVSGLVTLASNDPTGPFRFTVTGAVTAPPAVQILNNGQTGFTTTGGWTPSNVEGHLGSVLFSVKGTGSNTASWAFAVSPGRFRISATWSASVNRATDAPYTIYDNTSLLGTVRINQEQIPNDFADSNVSWKNLGVLNIASNRIVVTLTNAANEYVIADAIRIERLGDAVFAAETSVFADSSTLVRDATVSFGSALVGGPVSKTFIVTNTGNQPLVLGAITATAGFTVAASYGSSTLAPNASTTFTLQLSAAAPGSFSGIVSLPSNDPNSPFRFTVTGTVTAPPTVQVLNNGQPGFSTSGAWTASTVEGHGGSVLFSIKGSGSNTASWAFNVTPGRFRISATWSASPNRATDAPYSIYDNTTLAATVRINQEQAPADFIDAGGQWKDLGILNIAGNRVVVTLSNAANEYVIADAIRIERLGDAAFAPEIAVADGTSSVVNTSTVSFGSVIVGAAATKTFTVRNTGNQPLVLGAISVPAGFSLASGYGSTTLAPGASTTFSLRLDTAAANAASGTVSLASNDPNSPFLFTVAGTVTAPPTVQILNNGQAGFSTSGAWMASTTEGHGGSVLFSVKGSGSNMAYWAFDVAPGRYRIAATWSASINRATDAPYSIFDNSTLAASVRVNQEQTPADFADAGGQWKDLGILNIAGNRMVVTLSNAANEYVIADAIRIERLGDALFAPELAVADGSTSVAKDATVSFGNVLVGQSITKTLTVKNTGNQTLTLGQIDVPVGVSIVTGFGSSSLAPGASTTFVVRLDTSTPGTKSGIVSLASNDPTAPFRFTIAGAVTSPPTVQILDNGQAGFSASGAWTPSYTEGRGGSVVFSALGSGSNVATWNFTVAPGQYRVSATWSASPNRATNAPFSIHDGSTLLTSVAINQEQTPNDFTDAGAGWKNLGVVTVVGNQLIVRLTNAANEYVIADAIRIERIG